LAWTAAQMRPRKEDTAGYLGVLLAGRCSSGVMDDVQNSKIQMKFR